MKLRELLFTPIFEYTVEIEDTLVTKNNTDLYDRFKWVLHGPGIVREPNTYDRYRGAEESERAARHAARQKAKQLVRRERKRSAGTAKKEISLKVKG